MPDATVESPALLHRIEVLTRHGCRSAAWEILLAHLGIRIAALLHETGGFVDRRSIAFIVDREMRRI